MGPVDAQPGDGVRVLGGGEGRVVCREGGKREGGGRGEGGREGGRREGGRRGREGERREGERMEAGRQGGGRWRRKESGQREIHVQCTCIYCIYMYMQTHRYRQTDK